MTSNQKFAWYLCIAPNSWGRGRTRDAAMTECKKHWGALGRGKMKHYILYGFTSKKAEPLVNPDGAISWRDARNTEMVELENTLEGS